jgi:hypothetical protein
MMKMAVLRPGGLGVVWLGVVWRRFGGGWEQAQART